MASAFSKIEGKVGLFISNYIRAILSNKKDDEELLEKTHQVFVEHF